MTEYGAIETENLILEETPEQAAHAISLALNYLRLEARAIGMLDVSELIGRACAKANEYRPPRRVN
jgi:hypothetical protein